MSPYRQYATISPHILLFLKRLHWELFPQIDWRNESKQITIWNSVMKALAENIADDSFIIYYLDLYWKDPLFLDSYFD